MVPASPSATLRPFLPRRRALPLTLCHSLGFLRFFSVSDEEEVRGNHVDGETYGLRVRFEDYFGFLLSFLSVCSPVFLFLFLFFSPRKGGLATPTATEGRSESPTCLRMRDNGALMAPLDDGALQVDGFARRL